MAHTSPEPDLPDAPRGTRRHRRRRSLCSLHSLPFPCQRGRTRVWAVACALGAAFLLLPASAYAEPGVEELQAKIDKLADKAEVLTEKHNSQQVKLKKARKAARQAKHKSQNMDKQLRHARSGIAELAANRYKNGGARQSMAIMAGESPEEIIDRATLLNQLSRQRAAKLTDLKASVRQAQQAEKKAKKAASKVEKITQDLEKKKDRITDLVSKVKDKLAEVRAENAQAASESSSAPVDVQVVGSGKAARAAEIALAQQGKPYQWGAQGPSSFDCSGLVNYAYEQVGVSLPRSTSGLDSAGPEVSRSDLRSGDLVFTSSHHVGIYVGNQKMVNAPQAGEDVQVESIADDSLYTAVRVS